MSDDTQVRPYGVNGAGCMGRTRRCAPTALTGGWSGDEGEAAHVGAEDVGHGDGAVGVLVGLQDRDHDAGEGEAGPVEGVEVLDLARATLAEDLGQAPRVRQLRIIEAHGAIVRLAAQAPTFNFDAGLLVMEIGGLLASAAMPRAAA